MAGCSEAGIIKLKSEDQERAWQKKIKREEPLMEIYSNQGRPLRANSPGNVPFKPHFTPHFPSDFMDVEN